MGVDLTLRKRGGRAGVQVPQQHPRGQLHHVRGVRSGATSDQLDVVAQIGQGVGLGALDDVQPARITGTGLGGRGGVEGDERDSQRHEQSLVVGPSRAPHPAVLAGEGWRLSPHPPPHLAPLPPHLAPLPPHLRPYGTLRPSPRTLRPLRHLAPRTPAPRTLRPSPRTLRPLRHLAPLPPHLAPPTAPCAPPPHLAPPTAPCACYRRRKDTHGAQSPRRWVPRALDAPDGGRRGRWTPGRRTPGHPTPDTGHPRPRPATRTPATRAPPPHPRPAPPDTRHPRPGHPRPAHPTPPRAPRTPAPRAPRPRPPTPATGVRERVAR